jgi:hypothetical protein
MCHSTGRYQKIDSHFRGVDDDRRAVFNREIFLGKAHGEGSHTDRCDFNSGVSKLYFL